MDADLSQIESPKSLRPSWEPPASLIRDFSKPSSLRSATQIFLELALLAGSIAICKRFWNPAVYFFTVIWIGARQHALLVLMHDAAHGRLFRNRKWNDGVGELLAWLLFVTLHGFRKSHLAHHQYLGTEKDPDLMYWKDSPDYRFPMTRTRFSWVLASYAFGLKAFDQLRIVLGYLFTPKKPNVQANSEEPQTTKRNPLPRILFYVGIAALCTGFHLWRELALYWLVPAFTWLAAILYFRSAIEHYALDGSTHPLRATRTWVTGPLARIFIAPNGIQYHIEHHLYPSVPFHRLPEFHARMMAKPEYREKAHLTYGLRGAFKEMTAGR